MRLSLDGVPKNIDMEKIKEAALKIKGVRDIHHIHVWAMSTTENAMTAHIIIQSLVDKKQVASVKEELKHDLLNLNVQHVTLETEFE